MPKVSPFSSKVIKKAMPAILLAVFIFITLLLVARYTEAIFLVILFWIVIPVVAVQCYRKMKGWLGRDRKD